jgi:prepilin-type N-terminal cleavage/methylation domain-containing protein
MKSHSRAFTLVELLIVIAIVGILTAVLFGSTATSRSRTRDDRRITDLKQIQLALALYFDVYRDYPNGADASALGVLVAERFLPEIPTDPQGGAPYEYAKNSSEKKYCLGATLEGSIPSDTVSCVSAAGESTANYKVQR